MIVTSTTVKVRAAATSVVVSAWKLLILFLSHGLFPNNLNYGVGLVPILWLVPLSVHSPTEKNLASPSSAINPNNQMRGTARIAQGDGRRLRFLVSQALQKLFEHAGAP